MSLCRKKSWELFASNSGLQTGHFRGFSDILQNNNRSEGKREIKNKLISKIINYEQHDVSMEIYTVTRLLFITVSGFSTPISI